MTFGSKLFSFNAKLLTFAAKLFSFNAKLFSFVAKLLTFSSKHAQPDRVRPDQGARLQRLRSAGAHARVDTGACDLEAGSLGVVRAIFGWAVGLPVLLFVGIVFSTPDETVLIASLAIPRLALSAWLIDAFFKPRGGRSETALWAMFSVVLATAIDAFLLLNYQKIEWLRIGWC